MNTKEYIEKVSKAKEIQGLCKYEKGDWIYFRTLEGETMVLTKNLNKTEREHLGFNYWLPTLEQLFGMLNFENCIYKTIWELNEFLQDTICRGYEDINEALLDFVMEKEFNKFWCINVNDWEVIV